MNEELFEDEYETFDNVDIPTQEDIPDKKKFNQNKVSIIMLGLLLVFSIVNFALCINLYKKYDKMQIDPASYFQNEIDMLEGDDDLLVGYIQEQITTSETAQETTIKHITISTSAAKTSEGKTSSQTTCAQTSSTQTAAEPTATTSVQTTQESKSSLVNINTATLEELTALSNIGAVKAQAIIDYREENGRFNSVEELTNVSGIGEKTLEKNIDRITVD